MEHQCRKPEENGGVPSHYFEHYRNGAACQCGGMQVWYGRAVRVEGVRMAEYAGSDPT